MSKISKVYSVSLKQKVALEAIREETSLSELSSRHGVSSKQIGRWKQQALDGINTCFSDNNKKVIDNKDAEISILHEKIGKLVVERDFLLKASAK